MKKVAEGVWVAVAAPAYKVNCNTAIAQLDFTHIAVGHGEVVGREWLAIFRGYVRDMVAAVRREVGTGATLDEVKQRVTAALAPTYEQPFSTYGEYRPWRIGVAGNVERTFAMVS